jgi:hypothetical protein
MDRRICAASVALSLALLGAGSVRAEDGAAFRVDEASLDLGRVVAGQTAYATYTFRNDGSTPVRILQVKPSCGCTVADYDRVIPAGGTGELRASVSTTPQQSGAFSKSIYVVTDADSASRLHLRFTVRIHQPVIGKPRLRMTLRGVEGDAVTGGLLLRRSDGAPLQIYEANPGRALLSARVTPVDTAGRLGDFDAQPGDVWVELIGSQELPVGVVQGTLRLQTNHPELDVLEVPYTVRVQSPAEVRPEVVRLWLGGRGGAPGRRTIVGLRWRDGSTLRITGVSVSHPDVFAAAANPGSEHGYQRVRVQLADDLEDGDLIGSLDGHITVETDNPSMPKVVIPVIVAPSEVLTHRPPQTNR